jgi:hypothetical protein
MFDRSNIDQYEKGGQSLRDAVRGLSREEMLKTPPASAGVGLWSIHQIVIHLMDSDLIGTDRIKRLIAEDRPHVFGYNESKYVNNLFYHEQSVEDAMTMIDLNRKNFAKVLRKLPDSAFERIGTHSEAGEIKVESQIKKYNEHLDYHIGFIEKKRKWMGKT